ncbi:MAG: PAS domain S-box protein [Bacteroidetes bacterium]|nr:PAS domain S-box protein [Bacteroidota bacterium]
MSEILSKNIDTPKIAQALEELNAPGQKMTETDYFKFIEGLPVAVYTCDQNGFVRLFNKSAAELWGREPEIGKDLWCGSLKIYNVDGKPLSPDANPMAIAVKEVRTVVGAEIIIERPDGTRRNVNPHPQPVFDADGKLMGAVNMLTDITDQKIIEEKMGNMVAIVQSSDDAIISKTLQGIVTSWNDSARRIFGYTEEEMVGQSISKIIPKDRSDEEKKILERIRNGERVDHFETQRETKNGTILDISLTISPVKDSKGNIIGASKIARNITAQKAAERKIREVDERFRMAVESTKLGTWDYYPLSGILSWSNECRKIFDVPEDFKIDMDFFATHIHPDDINFAQAAIQRSMDPTTTGDYDIQYRILRYSDGEPRWIRAQGKVYFNDNNQAERFIGTVLDITEEKLAKEKLEKTVRERTIDLIKLNEQLEKSNLELEQYAYIASHDLQEPLRKIQTFSEMLKKNIHNEADFKKYFDKINQSAKRMTTLINDVLNYSRLTHAMDTSATVDLNQVVFDAQSDLELMIEQKNALIQTENLPSIPGVASQLRQLFSNLINNSIKFCEKEPIIHISSKILSAEEIKEFPELKSGSNFVALYFQDNGIGFEKVDAEQIFVIFRRLNNRSEYQGTGIGLALCKKIAENHGGTIRASSEKGKGAAFTIVLPALS